VYASPCACFQTGTSTGAAAPGRALGAQPPILPPAPGHKAAAERKRKSAEEEEEERVCVQFPTSISKGAKMPGAQTALHASQQSPHLGKAS